MADVTFTRSEYDNALPGWEEVEDVCAGEAAIKAKEGQYLPKHQVGDDADARYKRYLFRACFVGFAGRTLQSIIGAVFRKWPELVVPTSLDCTKKNVDGAGVSIYQQSQSVLSEVMKKGRHGLLVDYPKTEKSTSKAELAKGNVRATIVSIDAKQIVNWRTAQVGGIHKLSLVVIWEFVTEETEDGFGLESIEQYRVLRLFDGVYAWQIWRHDKNQNAWVIDDSAVPRDGKGKLWDTIPFTFVGAKNNDSNIDLAPMSELARANLHHYLNSADFEYATFFQSHPQPTMNMDDTHFRMMKEEGVKVGPDELLPVPIGGRYELAQASGDSLAVTAMEQKVGYIVALGGRLIQKGEAVKTATEAQNDNESEHSVLSLAASNVSEAYTQCLEWMARFMNADGSEASYTLSQDLVTPSLDAQTILAFNAIVDGAKMPKSDFWTYLRRIGLIDPEKTDEDIKEEIEGQGDGLGLDNE